MQPQSNTLNEQSEKFSRKSKREVFLTQMEEALPWGELLALTEPHYSKMEGDQPPYALAIMLRSYFLQQWFNLSDLGTEEALYESPVLRRFAEVDLDVAAAPGKLTLGRFRRLLDECGMSSQLQAIVKRSMASGGIRVPSDANEENLETFTVPKASATVRFTDFYQNVKDERPSHIAKVESVFQGANALSIAVISPNEHRRSAAIHALGICHSGPIREYISYPPNLEDVPRTLNRDFDVIMVDLDSDPEYALNLVKSISINGLATVIIYSEKADPDMLIRSMRSGAREFLTLPFAAGVMSEALGRASVIRAADRPEKKQDGKLLVFLAAKGGSGVTTLACNYAVSLAKSSGKKTLLIDLNLPLGDAAIIMGIKAQHTVVDALSHFNRLDSHFLSTLLVRHGSGLFVLAAPAELATTQLADEAINKLLDVACQDFDYVVVDAGSRLDLRHTHLFDNSAKIYLVTQVGIPELRNSNRLITKLSAEGSPQLEIVINRHDPRSQEIGDAHIAKALTREAEWKIPNNYAAVRKMQNTATPLTDDDSPISRAIQEMTSAVTGQTQVPAEKRKGFSFFR
jgi:pilus assembly protein CpaE